MPPVQSLDDDLFPPPSGLAALLFLILEIIILPPSLAAVVIAKSIAWNVALLPNDLTQLQERSGRQFDDIEPDEIQSTTELVQNALEEAKTMTIWRVISVYRLLNAAKERVASLNRRVSMGPA